MKVICINDLTNPSLPTSGEAYQNGIVKGQVYTVTKVYESLGQTYFELAEAFPLKSGWHHSRFRPFNEEKDKKSTDTGFKILDDIRKQMSQPVSKEDQIAFEIKFPAGLIWIKPE